MNWIRRLVDFRGSAQRSEFWLISIVVAFASRILEFMSDKGGAWEWAGLPILVLIVPHVAVAIRRLHDRGRSGWWALLFIGLTAVLGGLLQTFAIGGAGLTPLLAVVLLVLIVVGAWGFVELGVLPGKVRNNRYVPTAATAGAL